ncbi:hypothetical protein M3603_15265 [Rummeliibacillus stabekisii]|uniref:hypothetical protein n=1 Tax=Rummeliibacillus stabekisii TaxID=241244 RepID=UPI002041D927|nr:hypothetical protein [Rummeliibacillus stabekisii]MCM3317977.1 hypothetical protein [Rummeliibacillus stabekisii]
MNIRKSKAPIILMVVCFFLFRPQFHAEAILSNDVSSDELNTAKSCKLTIDANKHIADNDNFAEADGMCRGQVRGYYLKANDSFNIIGSVSTFVNYSGEKFDFLVEPSGDLAILTVKIIEPKISTKHTKTRAKNEINYKKNHQVSFNEKDYLDENYLVKDTKKETVSKEKVPYEVSNGEKNKHVKKEKDNPINYSSILISILLGLLILAVLVASHSVYKKMKKR